ncbi:MHO_1590 family protein [Mycoplasma seminis]|uniref:Uncharacterized protein n=1 Tax=Mycoplasma seminis TaxID=512749 RepID=A0ABY9HA09_9MOLU|nr:hypothetical protein [Mycoplasma seminis]WLP85433.1 hypothetical protein Q8852_03875 [Mycoplasma seminis]
MKRNPNLWIKSLSLLAVIVGASGAIGAGGYFLYKKFAANQKATKPIDSVKPKPVLNKDRTIYKSVFPPLDTRYFEQFVKKDKMNNKYIDEELIKQIIKDIIRRIRQVNGKVYFDYNILNRQHAVLNLMFISSETNEKDEKAYEILLD